MRRVAKVLFWTMTALLLTAQFVQPPSRSEQDGQRRTVWDDPHVTPEVQSILRRSCADCHSEQTRWPWYARIAPASWIVVHDVDRGRKKLNLSNWPLHPENEEEEIGDAVASGTMPPQRYLFLHPASRLSQRDKIIVDRWVEEQFKFSGSNMKW